MYLFGDQTIFSSFTLHSLYFNSRFFLSHQWTIKIIYTQRILTWSSFYKTKALIKQSLNYYFSPGNRTHVFQFLWNSSGTPIPDLRDAVVPVVLLEGGPALLALTASETAPGYVPAAGPPPPIVELPAPAPLFELPLPAPAPLVELPLPAPAPLVERPPPPPPAPLALPAPPPPPPALPFILPKPEPVPTNQASKYFFKPPFAFIISHTKVLYLFKFTISHLKQ